MRAELGTVVLWEGWSGFARADEDAFTVALDIVGQRTESPHGGAFVVLMPAEIDPSASVHAEP